MKKDEQQNEAARVQLPEIGFLKLRQIIGNKKQKLPPIIPVSKSGWYEGIQPGMKKMKEETYKFNRWKKDSTGRKNNIFKAP
jgi:hypothetical protein